MADSSQRSGKVGRRASLWALVVFIPWAAVMWLGLHDWYNEILLGKHAATTPGVITRIEHDNHQRNDYEYSVEGVTYAGGEIVAGVSLAVGQKVQVWYLPDSPGTSQLTRFGEVGTRPVPFTFFTVLALYVYFRFRRLLQGPENPDDR